MKRLLSVFLIAAVLLSALSSLSVPVAAESLYIRKIVSVVYDDSGSMSGSKWAYANYAMQAFCGMLNSEDKLFITYMSHAERNPNYDPQQVDLSSGGIQNSIDSIENHNDSGSTPYGAVTTAYNKLSSIKDSNPNTQYWLVVITDGSFNEIFSLPDNEKKDFLNKEIKGYTEGTMPNGSNPQVTFMGIGDVVLPDQDHNKGIFTYSAQNSGEIINTMAQMADKISGRTRLQKSDIKKLDGKTMQVSSSIPLLNIAVFAQGTDAKIQKVVYSNETTIPIVRNANLKYPGNSDLVGEAYLIGDSKTVIGAGSYKVTFDKDIDPDDVIILFEPALEMRMTVTVNGKEISDYSDLDDTMDGDKISISCKIYEMGTDTEIDPKLLPPGTKFEVTVFENGNVAEKNTGEDMTLSEYALKNTNTEIKAAVIIEGFNPIEFSKKFTPAEYIPKITYTIVPSFGSNTKSVKFDDIANNKELTVCFTIYADGIPMTNVNAVKALNPVISVSPQGNSGNIEYAKDGKIIFIPTSASMTTSDSGSFDVEVTCTIDDGTTASEIYTVLIADYQIFKIDATSSVRKHKLYDNQTGVSFYVTKDGVKLGKSEVEKHISILLNEEHQNLKTAVVVAPDGTITVTPYSDEEYTLTFWNWWVNWFYYFGLEDEDISVTMIHSFGSATSVIDVVEAEAKYLILNVFLPLIIELLVVALIVAYVIRYKCKAKFAPNGVLYIGNISLTNIGSSRAHLMDMVEVHLNQYNKFKYLWNPFKELTVQTENGMTITAKKGNRIYCHENFPWGCRMVKPLVRTVNIQSPKDIVRYCSENDSGEIRIQEIPATCVMDEQNPIISQDDSVYYFARIDPIYVNSGTKQTEVIDSAIVFCYSTIQN